MRRGLGSEPDPSGSKPRSVGEGERGLSSSGGGVRRKAAPSPWKPHPRGIQVVAEPNAPLGRGLDEATRRTLAPRAWPAAASGAPTSQSPWWKGCSLLGSPMLPNTCSHSASRPSEVAPKGEVTPLAHPGEEEGARESHAFRVPAAPEPPGGPRGLGAQRGLLGLLGPLWPSSLWTVGERPCPCSDGCQRELRGGMEQTRVSGPQAPPGRRHGPSRRHR